VRQEGHLACKKLGVGLLMVMIWLELCTSYDSSCQLHFHAPIKLANPGSPGKMDVKMDKDYWSPFVFVTSHDIHICE